VNGIALAALLLLAALFTGFAIAGSPEAPDEVDRRG